MKRLLFLMALLLIFTGCAAETEESAPHSQFPSAASAEAEPSVDASEAVETSLLTCTLSRTGCSSIVPLGDDFLLFSGGEATTLTLLSGADLSEIAETTLDCGISSGSPAVQVSEKGVTYYHEATLELVFLDATLKEVSRFPMPEGITGTPALTVDRKTIYYCNADSLRCIDLETGLDKLLKEMSFDSHTVSGLHCGETVLECTVAGNDGSLQTLFLSTLTGETLAQVAGTIALQTNGEAYFAVHDDGAYTELILGTGSADPQLLRYEEAFESAAPVLELGCAVLTRTYENAAGLDCYDLAAGTRTAALNAEGLENIRDIRADAAGQYIWFLAYDSAGGCDILCRWDPSLDAVDEDTSYLTRRYTREYPDAEGLSRCAETAAALSAQYGVEILVWTDATAFQNDEYSLTAEYQVPLIEESLQQLADALACYPEGFLSQAASATESGTLKICLVRSLGSEETSQQYWTEDSACIALCPGENLDRDFHHQLFFILENRVLGNCTTYDNWNSLNPDDFSYTLDYEAAEALEGSQWLEGDSRAFIDLRSMSFPREDRAAIMEYAITDGNESYFESDTMQQKLRKLCTGIRKAFDLKDSEEIFLWEQYLEEPLNQ